MYQEALKLTIKFVAENSEGNITNATAATSDFTCIILYMLLLLIIASTCILLRKRFLIVASHVDKQHAKIQRYKNLTFKILLSGFVVIFASLLFLSVFKLGAFAKENGSFETSPLINAYVKDNGDVYFDEGFLNSSDGEQFIIDEVNVNICDGVSQDLSSIKLAANTDTCVLYEGNVPGTNSENKLIESRNKLSFNIEGMSVDVAKSLIDKQVFTFAFSVRKIDPTISHTVTFNPNNGLNPWTVNVNEGDLVPKPEEDPVKLHHEFIAWIYQNEPYDFNNLVIDNILLSATWQESKEINDEPVWTGGSASVENFYYNGEIRNVSDPKYWNNFNEEQLEISGDIEECDAGDYVAKFFPKFGYCWPDGSKISKEIQWGIAKRVIKITSEGDEKIYDGTSLTKQNVIVSEPGFVNGEGAIYDFSTSITDVGSCQNEFTYTLSDGTKASNYEISTESGTLTIIKAPLKVTTASANKAYDGVDLTKNEGTIDGLIEDETAEINCTGVQKSVGSSKNTYTISWVTAKEGNYEVKEEILGTLTVTQYEGEIVATVTGGTFTYDGDEHGATVSLTNLPPDYTYSASSNATATHYTEYDVVAHCDECTVFDDGGHDVTDKLKINKVPGFIKINKASLTTTTEGASKVYDGSPLVGTGSITGLVNDETVSVTYTSITDVTTPEGTDNICTITFDGSAQAADYSITSSSIGKLKVTKRDIKFTGVVNGWSYDGQAHMLEGVTFGEGQLISGHTHNCVYSATGTDIGEYSGTITASDQVIISDAGGKSVTGNYNITTAPGKLYILGDSFGISLETDTHTYDGTAKYNTKTPVSEAPVGVTHFTFSFDSEGEYVDDLSSLTKINANTDSMSNGYPIYIKATNEKYYDPNTGKLREMQATSYLKINRAPRTKVELSKNSLSLIAQSNSGISVDYPSETVKLTVVPTAATDHISIATATSDIASFTVNQQNITVSAIAGGSKTFTIKIEDKGSNKNYLDAEISLTVNVDNFTYATVSQDEQNLDGNVMITKYIGLQTLDNATVADSVTVPGATPGESKLYNITDVGDGTNCIFSNSQNSYIKNLSLGANVTKISDKAFKESGQVEKLVSVNNCGNITTIGTSAFEDNKSLTKFDSSTKVATIGESAFNGCSSLQQFGPVAGAIKTTPALTSLGQTAFAECRSASLLNIDLSLSTNSAFITIPRDCFNYCEKVSSIKIPNNIATIGYAAFANVDKKDSSGITYDDNNTTILWARGATCERLEMSDQIRLVATNAFGESGSPNTILKKLIINKTDDSVHFNDGAFSYCSVLETYLETNNTGSINYGQNVLTGCGASLQNAKELIVAGNLSHLPNGTPAASVKMKYIAVSSVAELKTAIGTDENYCFLTADLSPGSSDTFTINKKVTVDLNGKQINNMSARAFTQSGSTFYLLDTSLTAGTKDGGHIKGQENSSQNQGGGGIRVESGTVKAYDSCLYSCYAYDASTADPCGGGIYLVNSNAKCYVYNCYFYDCKTWDCGGAIWACQSSVLEIYGGAFESCYAENKGGAIFVQTNAKIDNAKFSYNFAEGANPTINEHGGAIYFSEKGTSTIKNCKFENNSAYGGGGALYVDPDTIVKISGKSSFIGNHSGKKDVIDYSKGDGGAIYSEGKVDIIGNSDDDRIVFQNNNGHDGGAIRNEQDIMNIQYVNFYSNTATEYGGAVYCTYSGIYEGKVNISYCDLKSNKDEDGIKDNTALVYNDDFIRAGSINVSNCTGQIVCREE